MKATLKALTVKDLPFERLSASEAECWRSGADLSQALEFHMSRICLSINVKLDQGHKAKETHARTQFLSSATPNV